MTSQLQLFKNLLRHQTWLPTLVVAVGVIVTIFLSQTLDTRESELAWMRFESLAEDQVQTIESRVRDAFEAVHLMAGFYQRPGDANWRTFQLYARSLQQRRPGLRMMVWAPRVTADQRADFEAEATPIGDEPFQITEQSETRELVPAGERTEYFPIYFVRPFEPHKPLWGFDLLTHPATRQAIETTMEPVELRATGPVMLHSGLGTVRSIWIVQRVYNQATAEQDQPAVEEGLGAPALAGVDEDSPRGVIAGVFEPRQMLDAILPRFRREQIILEIRDEDTAEPYDLVYDSRLTLEHSPEAADGGNNDENAEDDEPAEARWHLAQAAELADDAVPDFDKAMDERAEVYTERLHIAGRTWRITAAPTRDYLQEQRTWAPQLVLGGGLVITILLGLYLNNVLTRTGQVEEEVEQRTRELREMTSALRRSNESLEEFAYIASHDLQEPLRKVRGFGEMLAEEAGEALTTEQRDYLQRMQNAAARMQELITGLLTYSRVTTKRQPLQHIDLTHVLHQVVADLELRIQETGGRVEVDSLPEVEADPLQMRQLFQNLISNALKFHREDARPLVRVRGETLRSGRCQIKVEDNGIGFKPEESERIFKPFQRLHGRDTYDGTGMGLPVCKKIVERHGGSITARSKPGEGSTFTVILPCSGASGEASHGGTKSQTGHHPDGG